MREELRIEDTDTLAGACARFGKAWKGFADAVAASFMPYDEAAKRVALEIKVQRKVREVRRRRFWHGIKQLAIYALGGLALLALFVAMYILLALVIWSTPAGACEPPEVSDEPAILGEFWYFPEADPFWYFPERDAPSEPSAATALEEQIEGVRADILVLRPTVDPTWARELAELITEHGNEYDLDLRLVTALCMTESSFRINATNPTTYCAGLMQLHPCHGIADVYDPQVNMHWGCLKLRKYIDDRGGSIIGGLRRYGTKVKSVRYHLGLIGAEEVLEPK